MANRQKTKAVIAWPHSGAVISCGTSWLTITDARGQLLLRLQGAVSLHKFAELLDAGITADDGAGEMVTYTVKPLISLIPTKNGPLQLWLKPGAETGLAVLAIGSERGLVLHTMQLVDLLLWLCDNTKATTRLRLPDESGVFEFDAFGPLLIISFNHNTNITESVSMEAVVAQAIKQALFEVAREHINEPLRIDISPDQYVILAPGDEASWAAFNYHSGGVAKEQLRVGKTELVRMALKIEAGLVKKPKAGRR